MNDLSSIKFGDEIEPVTLYADDKKRKFIFMCWMGNDLAGFARIATLLEDGEGFDEQGKWVKIGKKKGRFGTILTDDHFVHKSKIKLLKLGDV